MFFVSRHTSISLLAAALIAPVSALVDYGLTSPQLRLIRDRLTDAAQRSWELGTAAQAFLELDFPDLSVYGTSPFPPPYSLNTTSSVMSIATRVVNERPAGSLQLMNDGSAADPMSNAIAVLLGGYTASGGDEYLNAFRDQLRAIMEFTPRGPNGEISHRRDEYQLWADFASMVPPQLAYWGALQPGTEDERTYLHEAYNQLKLYRDALYDPETRLFRHVVAGSWSDYGFWATGQAWMANGFLRVYHTIAKSTLRNEMQWAMDDLLGWTEETVAATWQYQNPDGSLNNYLGRPDSFRELASTAFMAATTYRLAMLTDATDYVPNADLAFELVKTMIDENGWLLEPVNPHNFSDPGQQSAEGQAFVLMLQAAFRDYQSWRHGLDDSLGGAFKALTGAAERAKLLKESNKIPARHRRSRVHGHA